MTNQKFQWGGPFPVSITLWIQPTRTHYTELILLTNLAGLKQAPLLKRVRDILLCFYQRGVKCWDLKRWNDAKIDDRKLPRQDMSEESRVCSRARRETCFERRSREQNCSALLCLSLLCWTGAAVESCSLGGDRFKAKPSHRGRSW